MSSSTSVFLCGLCFVYFFPFISDLNFFCDMLNGYRRGEGVEIQIQNFSM